MLIINVISLMAVAFLVGYYIGKGKIEVVKKVALSQEDKDRINVMEKKQQEVINDYNTALNELMRG